MKEVDSIYGNIHLPSDSGLDLISRFIEVYGEWAYSEVLLAAKLLKPNHIFWDVGAYLGSFSLGLCQQRLPSRILAIEPNRAIHSCLRVNLDRHLTIPWEIAPFAVSDRQGIGVLKNFQPGNLGASTVVSSALIDEGMMAVEITTLSALRKIFCNYDFLKIDAEGMESRIILGDRDYLKSNQPLIWAECNEAEDSFNTFEALKSLNYIVTYIAFPAFRTNNFKKAIDFEFNLAYEGVLIGSKEKFDFDLIKNELGIEYLARTIQSTNDLRSALWNTPRWSTEEWAKLQKPELISILGHLQKGDNYPEFFSNHNSTSNLTPPPLKCVESIDENSFEIRIFWRNTWNQINDGYAEEKSVACRVEYNSHIQKLCFSLPTPTESIDRIRIDISNQIGLYTVYSIECADENDVCLWEWDRAESLFSRYSQLMVLATKSCNDGIVLLSTGNDPWFELDLDTEISNKIKSTSKVKIQISSEKFLFDKNLDTPKNDESLSTQIKTDHPVIDSSLFIEPNIFFIHQKIRLQQAEIESAKIDLELLEKKLNQNPKLN